MEPPALRRLRRPGVVVLVVVGAVLLALVGGYYVYGIRTKAAIDDYSSERAQPAQIVSASSVEQAPPPLSSPIIAVAALPSPTPSPTAEPQPADAAPTDTDTTPAQCDWDNVIRIRRMSHFQLVGPASLEERILNADIVVRAKIVGDELEGAHTSDWKSLVPGHQPGDYYTALQWLELEVSEYMKGSTPDRITALVETMLFTERKHGIPCLMHLYRNEGRSRGQIDLGGDEGIVFLDSIEDSDAYFLSGAFQNFYDFQLYYSKWLPGDEGNFYIKEWREWMSLAEMRDLVTSVVEEYARHDNDEWRSCVYDKYYAKGKRRLYVGTHTDLSDYPSHILLYTGENAPLPESTSIWEFPNHDEFDLTMWLDGKDADLFEIPYYEEYQYMANRYNPDWIDGLEQDTVIWTLKPAGSEYVRQAIHPAHVLSPIEDLRQGVYKFRIHWRNNDAVDCGQDPPKPKEYTVVVTEEGGPLELALPPSPSTREWNEEYIEFALGARARSCEVQACQPGNWGLV